jgi:hypothetical protein
LSPPSGASVSVTRGLSRNFSSANAASGGSASKCHTTTALATQPRSWCASEQAGASSTAAQRETVIR